MRRMTTAALAAAVTVGSAAAAEKTRFWNLTENTITKLWFAPAGSTTWGPNQTANDRDGTVDHDERLTVTGLASGRFDVKFADAKGRVCIVHGVEVKVGEVFSIEETDVKSCKK